MCQLYSDFQAAHGLKKIYYSTVFHICHFQSRARIAHMIPRHQTSEAETYIEDHEAHSCGLLLIYGCPTTNACVMPLYSRSSLTYSSQVQEPQVVSTSSVILWEKMIPDGELAGGRVRTPAHMRIPWSLANQVQACLEFRSRTPSCMCDVRDISDFAAELLEAAVPQ